MISFSGILLSRGRPEMLDGLIKSFFGTSILDNQLIVGIDSDDSKTLDYISNQAMDLDVTFVIRNRNSNLHVYMNQLARLADGDYFLVLNDDCLLTNIGWDIKSLKILKQSRALYGRTHEDSIDKISNDYTGFPVISRIGYEKLGFLMDESFGNHGADVVTYMIYAYASMVIDLPDLTISHLFHNSQYALKNRLQDETAVNMVRRTYDSDFSINKLLGLDVSDKAKKLL